MLEEEKTQKPKKFLGCKRDIFHPKHGVEENMRKTISSFMESLV